MRELTEAAAESTRRQANLKGVPCTVESVQLRYADLVERFTALSRVHDLTKNARTALAFRPGMDSAAAQWHESPCIAKLDVPSLFHAAPRDRDCGQSRLGAPMAYPWSGPPRGRASLGADRDAACLYPAQKLALAH